MLTYTIKTTDRESKFCPVASNNPHDDLTAELMQHIMRIAGDPLYTTGKIKSWFPDLIHDGRHYFQKIEILNVGDPVAVILLPMFQQVGDGNPKVCWTNWKPTHGVWHVEEASNGWVKTITQKIAMRSDDIEAVLNAFHCYERSLPYQKEIRSEFIEDPQEEENRNKC